jgi:GNAT superfamily N-acetyltransferase
MADSYVSPCYQVDNNSMKDGDIEQIKGLEGIRMLLISQTQHTMCLETLVVEDEFRNKGLGSAAVRHIQDIARKRGARWLMVTMLPTSDRPGDLRKFYKKLGFQPRVGDPDTYFWRP